MRRVRKVRFGAFVADCGVVGVGEQGMLENYTASLGGSMGSWRHCGTRRRFGLAFRSARARRATASRCASAQRPCRRVPTGGTNLARACAHGNAARSAHVRCNMKAFDSTANAPALHVVPAWHAARGLFLGTPRSSIFTLPNPLQGREGYPRTRAGPPTLAYSYHSPDVASNLADDGTHVVLVPADPVLAGVQVQAGCIAVGLAADGGGPHWCQLEPQTSVCRGKSIRHV